jgi:hypothetical protein
VAVVTAVAVPAPELGITDTVGSAGTSYNVTVAPPVSVAVGASKEGVNGSVR